MQLQTLLLTLTLVVLLIVMGIGAALSRDMARLQTTRFMQEDYPMQTKTTRWTDSQGVEWSVTTQRASGETLESWCKRHDEAVDALQREHPPAR